MSSRNVPDRNMVPGKDPGELPMGQKQEYPHDGEGQTTEAPKTRTRRTTTKKRRNFVADLAAAETRISIARNILAGMTEVDSADTLQRIANIADRVLAGTLLLAPGTPDPRD